MKPLPILLAVAALGLSAAVSAASAPHEAVVYKQPYCDCCEGHIAYLREHGYTVQVQVLQPAELARLKQQAGVDPDLASCHTTLIDGYAIEGHVPVAAIERLLRERPAIRGISLPGMPAGAPGHAGQRSGPLVVMELGAPGPAREFMRD